MSDDLFLFIIIAVFYLVDCFVWVRRNAFVFVLSFWPVKNPGFAGHYWGNRSGGFYFVNPLPPLSSLFICQPLPLIFSPHALTAAPLRQDSLLIHFPSQKESSHQDKISVDNIIDNIKVEATKLLINGKLFALCGSNRAARRLHDLIKKMTGLTPDERLETIRHTIDKTFDSHALGQDIERFLVRSRLLRIFSNSMWVYLFVFSPLVLWLFGPVWLLPLLTGAIVLFHIPVVVFFSRTHRALCPESKSELQDHLIKAAFFPPAALRAIDYISAGLLAKYHPLTAAFVLCDKEQFGAFAVKTIRDLKYPVRFDTLTGEKKSVDEQYRQHMIAAVKSFLESRGFNMEEMLETGFDPDTAALSYCPRCLNEYIIAEGNCADCPGVELLPVTHAGPAAVSETGITRSL